MSPVAATILDQMGGNGFRVMCGVKHICYSDNSATFTIGGGAKQSIKWVKVTLDPSDTYSMEFINNRGNTKVTHSDVYCDMLRDIFTQETGFYTSMRR